jgi:RNA polymerase sigma factor (TIGR02999 family)
MGSADRNGGSITHGLRRGLGDAQAHGESLSEVHDQLLRIARAELARHRRGATLNTRALVNEVWLKLYGNGNVLDLASRKHFYATAARAMRQVVIDYARTRLTDMRGAGAEHLSLDSLDGQALQVDAQAEHLLQMDRALRRLAELDPRLVEVVELRFFAGMEVIDVAQLLGVSEPTVKRDTRVAKAFIARELGNA